MVAAIIRGQRLTGYELVDAYLYLSHSYDGMLVTQGNVTYINAYSHEPCTIAGLLQGFNCQILRIACS